MRFFDAYPTIFSIILIAVVATIFLGFSEISLTGLEATDLGTKFLTLIFMALVIERAVEIYLKNRFSEEESRLKQASRVAASAVKTYKEALEATAATVLPNIGPDADVQAAIEAKYDHVAQLKERLEESRLTLLDAKSKAEPKLRALAARKKRAATIAALALSLAVAIVGIRILTQFVPTGTLPIAETVKGAYQAQAFQAIDIILTALLLSGGADGIHQLVKDFLSDRDELLAAS
ncbi:MAG: hypothetical protein OXC60_21135 [Litoreibacter sp.]|nr:hypothetical protein [Litoreibacter sp.]